MLKTSENNSMVNHLTQAREAARCEVKQYIQEVFQPIESAFSLLKQWGYKTICLSEKDKQDIIIFMGKKLDDFLPKKISDTKQKEVDSLMKKTGMDIKARPLSKLTNEFLKKILDSKPLNTHEKELLVRIISAIHIPIERLNIVLSQLTITLNHIKISEYIEIHSEFSALFGEIISHISKLVPEYKEKKIDAAHEFYLQAIRNKISQDLMESYQCMIGCGVKERIKAYFKTLGLGSFPAKPVEIESREDARASADSAMRNLCDYLGIDPNSYMDFFVFAPWEISKITIHEAILRHTEIKLAKTRTLRGIISPEEEQHIKTCEEEKHQNLLDNYERAFENLKTWKSRKDAVEYKSRERYNKLQLTGISRLNCLAIKEFIELEQDSKLETWESFIQKYRINIDSIEVVRMDFSLENIATDINDTLKTFHQKTDTAFSVHKPYMPLLDAIFKNTASVKYNHTTTLYIVFGDTLRPQEPKPIIIKELNEYFSKKWKKLWPDVHREKAGKCLEECKKIAATVGLLETFCSEGYKPIKAGIYVETYYFVVRNLQFCLEKGDAFSDPDFKVIVNPIIEPPPPYAPLPPSASLLKLPSALPALQAIDPMLIIFKLSAPPAPTVREVEAEIVVVKTSYPASSLPMLNASPNSKVIGQQEGEGSDAELLPDAPTKEGEPDSIEGDEEQPGAAQLLSTPQASVVTDQKNKEPNPRASLKRPNKFKLFTLPSIEQSALRLVVVPRGAHLPVYNIS